MIKSILKSLLKPEAYPEPTNRVELVQTHASWIFLTDKHAYKVKKPVDFGFLNFSTIDRRRFYCNEEIKYNRRLCPDIYEGVVELIKNEDGAAFHGKGHVIDYAVKMKRLPAEFMLDKLIDNDAVTDTILYEVTKTIANFHLAAPTSPTVAAFGEIEKIVFNWKENIEQMIVFEDKTLSRSDRETIKSWVFEFVEKNSVKFAKRVSGGFIRECDGDLHLENICIYDDSVCIFDCIEFNERFRNCDTAADIAFLIMDLDYHNRHDFADKLLCWYIELTGDTSITELISFYKVYRAFVRGKVESLRLLEKDLEPKDQIRVTEKAIRYFRLARGYIERQIMPPTLFITCGLMGSGKSTIANQLAFELGIACFNSDKTRKTMAGLSLTTPIAASFQDGLYSTSNSDLTYQELLILAESEIAKNLSVIIDASFYLDKYRESFADLAKKYSINLVICFIKCSDSEIKQRLHKRNRSGLSISDGRVELFEKQKTVFETPTLNNISTIVLNSSTDLSFILNSIYYHRHHQDTIRP